jgi:tRNA-dihydrouridine synthase
MEKFRTDYSSSSYLDYGRPGGGRTWHGGVLDGMRDSKIHRVDVAVIMKRHLDIAVTMHGEHVGVIEMRNHLAWYVKGTRNATAFRDELFQSTDYKTIMEYINRNVSNARTAEY